MIRKGFFLLLGIGFFAAQSQTIADIVKQGDRDRNNGLYVKAINIYKEALEREPRHRGAKFGLAESYRQIFDYEQAEYYYDLVGRSNDPNYGMAKFNHGLMAKLNGKYAEALKIFQNFRQFLEEQKLEDAQNFQYYYKQARIEIDGCQLALNQMTMSHPNHVFQLLDPPANSEYSDYAAFSVDHDSLICLTSARQSGKGSLEDNQFGESFSDLFRFRFNGSKWEAYDPGDRFEKVVNTKWGDGSGSFNRDRTKFYYTNCDESLGDVCHIFVSELIDGKWSDPKPLNRNVNLDNANSKHPNLSPRGDTLFFASDRKGTYGQLDIWMSVNAGGDNWGPPQNLGKHVNTAFSEISPFYDQNEQVLFFSSNGHRGFGGMDIYVARGNTLNNAEIYNAGVPFNSNKDDIFFFLGLKKGYLTSNRDEGVGKFDIYGFNIQSKHDIVTEISSENTIAGRNSLFADDFNFDNRNTQVINQIISRRLSAAVTGADLVLTSDQLAVFNSLSDDDKNRIDRIVDARMRNMSSNDLRSVRSQDDFYYQNLSSDKRQQVDQLVSSYIEQQGLGLSVSLKDDAKNFYEGVDIKEQEQLDIFISERLKAAKNYLPTTPNYDVLGAEDKARVDGIVTKYVQQKRSLDKLLLSVQENAFVNNMDNPVQVNYAIRERLVALSRLPEFELKEEDQIFYQNLTEQHKESLKGMASSFLSTDISAFEASTKSEDVQMMSQYTGKRGETMDKLLVKLFSNLADADLYLVETYFTVEDLKSLGNASPEDAYNQLVRNNRNLTDEDRIALKRFVYSGFQSYLATDEPVFVNMMPEMAVVASENLDDDEIKKSIYPTPPVPTTVNPDDLSISGNYQEYALAQSIHFDAAAVQNKYKRLPEAERKLLDRVVAEKLINDDYNQHPEWRTSDGQFYKDLVVAEQGFVDVMTKSVAAQPLTSTESSLLPAAEATYLEKSQSEQNQWARIIYANTLEEDKKTYSLSRPDKEAFERLPNEIQELRDQLVTLRKANGKWLPVERQPLAESDLSPAITLQTALDSYERLDPARQLAYDRLIAFQYLEATYNSSPSQQSQDRQWLDAQSAQIQMYADIMAKILSGKTLTDKETADLARSINYFDSQDVATKCTFARAMYQQLFNPENTEMLSRSSEDQAFNSTLSENEKQIIEQMLDFRSENGQFINTQQLAPMPEQLMSTLSRATEAAYKNLPASTRLLMDKAAAVEFLNTSYDLNPLLINDDQNFYTALDRGRKDQMALVISVFKGDILDEQKAITFKETINYFQSLGQKDKEAFVRNVFQQVFKQDAQNRYLLSSAEKQDINNLDAAQQELLTELKSYRSATGNFIHEDLLAPVPVKKEERPIPEVSLKTLQYYEGLAPSQQLQIDRIVAIQYLNNQYSKNSGDQSAEDELFFKQLEREEKDHVRMLAKHFSGTVLNQAERSFLKGSFTFYSNLAPTLRAQYNTAILSRVFKKNEQAFILSEQDQQALSALNASERQMVDELILFRSLNQRIITENQLPEANDQATSTIALQLPTFDASGFKDITIRGQLIGDRTGQPKAQHPVSLQAKTEEQTTYTVFTNNNGEFVFTVPNLPYSVVTERPAEEAVYVKDFDIKGQQVVPDEIFSKLTQAYFNSDAADLRPEGKVLLDEIIAEYGKGSVKINVEAHTDNQGNERYNEILSKRRGYSALEYLAQNKIPKSDLSVQWYGKEQPKTVNSNPYGRQLNRRIDIELAANAPINYNPGVYFLVRPNATLQQIASNTQLSIADIKKWNGMTSNELEDYQPLRLKLKPGIEPNANLLIPANASVDDDFLYTVKSGENVISIAQKFNIPEELIMEMNNLTSPQLETGQVISIYVKY